MKIIKQGVLPENEVYQNTCSYCKCEFEYIRAEAKFTSDQREGDYLTIDCPCYNSIRY